MCTQVLQSWLTKSLQATDAIVKPAAEATPAEDDVVNTIEDDTTAPALDQEEETNAIVLDPNTSDRQYYRDQITRIQREIWRPGTS